MTVVIYQGAIIFFYYGGVVHEERAERSLPIRSNFKCGIFSSRRKTGSLDFFHVPRRIAKVVSLLFRNNGYVMKLLFGSGHL